jgi:dCMP deaminase
MNADSGWLREAYAEAAKSLDPSTQNGAVLVLNGRCVGRGFNHFPRGVDNDAMKWLDRDFKYAHVVHAETAAIMDAARQGPTNGSVLYGCWVACMECAKDIIEAGVVELVGHHHQAMDERPDWVPGIERAFAMLRGAGVGVRIVEGDVGANLRFNGKAIEV